MASAPSGQSQWPQPALRRVTISITAMPCSTPKVMLLLGNIWYEPAVTNSAQPATWAQRFQNRGQP